MTSVGPPGERRLSRALDSDWFRGPLKSFGSRLALLPILAVIGFITSRIVIDRLGSDGFAIYGLVIGLAALMPFADLGLGAAVTDAVARRETVGDDEVRAVVARSRLLLVRASLVVLALTWGLAAIGAWGPILNVQGYPAVNVAVAMALSLFAISLPLSLSARALLGAERNHWVVASQGVSAVTALIIVLAAAAANAGVWAYASAPFVGMLVAGIVNTWWARDIAGGGVRGAIGSRDRARDRRIVSLAGPMLVIAISLPVAWQTDRLVLSHATNLGQVAVYVLAFQLFAPLSSLVETAGSSLWPVFARRRDTASVGGRQVAWLTAGYASVGLALGAVLVLFGGPIMRWISQGEIDPTWSLLFAFSALIVSIAAWYPSAMLLTSPEGMRFQAWCSALMAAVNLPLSFALASAWGASGPVVASVVALLVCVALPGWWRVRTQLTTKRS